MPNQRSNDERENNGSEMSDGDRARLINNNGGTGLVFDADGKLETILMLIIYDEEAIEDGLADDPSKPYEVFERSAGGERKTTCFDSVDDAYSYTANLRPTDPISVDDLLSPLSEEVTDICFGKNICEIKRYLDSGTFDGHVASSGSPQVAYLDDNDLEMFVEKLRVSQGNGEESSPSRFLELSVSNDGSLVSGSGSTWIQVSEYAQDQLAHCLSDDDGISELDHFDLTVEGLSACLESLGSLQDQLTDTDFRALVIQAKSEFLS